jgi:hypothetical protein
MKLNVHPNIRIQKLIIGEEKAPLLIIDNFIDQADELVTLASKSQFVEDITFYPGIRSPAPRAYQTLFLSTFRETLVEYFQLNSPTLGFSACEYSIVTKEPNELKLLQRIPHFDSLNNQGLATVHYLFKQELGGTSFYRHRKTGYEYIDEGRKITYLRSLESENGTGNVPMTGYICGDTPLFEQIYEPKGIFNRILIYRRNSLHSGSISNNFKPDPSPSTGRLSINSFIDPIF